MSRSWKLTGLFLIAIFINNCQSYTSGLQQSVARADETAALALVKSIAVAETTYSISNEGEYATLKQLVDAGLLDERYAGEKPLRDYVITVTVTPKAAGNPTGSFTCNADPDQTQQRAGRHFYVDASSNGIHVNDTQPATASDKLME